MTIFNYKEQHVKIAKVFNVKPTVVTAIKTGQNYSTITGKKYTPIPLST